MTDKRCIVHSIIIRFTRASVPRENAYGPRQRRPEVLIHPGRTVCGFSGRSNNNNKRPYGRRRGVKNGDGDGDLNGRCARVIVINRLWWSSLSHFCVSPFARFLVYARLKPTNAAFRFVLIKTRFACYGFRYRKPGARPLAENRVRKMAARKITFSGRSQNGSPVRRRRVLPFFFSQTSKSSPPFQRHSEEIPTTFLVDESPSWRLTSRTAIAHSDWRVISNFRRKRLFPTSLQCVLVESVFLTRIPSLIDRRDTTERFNLVNNTTRRDER